MFHFHFVYAYIKSYCHLNTDSENENQNLLSHLAVSYNLYQRITISFAFEIKIT